MRRVVCTIFAAIVCLAPRSLQAQVQVDMNHLKCGTVLRYSTENKNFVAYWMSGYYSASRNDDVRDFDRLQKRTDAVIAYCKRHRADPLPKAINKTAI